MPFDHFSSIAGLYDRLAQFRLTEPLASLLSLSPGQILLDAGGGTGRVAAALRSQVRRSVVADLSLAMVHRAAEKDLESVCAPAERLPFASGTFDRIIMLDALHHVRDQAQTVSELWRVLSVGGRLVIVEPDIAQFAVKLIALVEKILLMRSHILSGRAIMALFEDLGTRPRLIYSDHNVIVLLEKVREM